MAILVRNGEVIYFAANNVLAVKYFQRLSFASASITTETQLKLASESILAACKEIDERSIVLTYELYAVPGLLESLKTSFPRDYTISSAVDGLIGQVAPGKFSVIVIERNACWVLAGDNDDSGFSGFAISKLAIGPFQKDFFTAISRFLLPGVTNDQVFDALFDYQHILALNDLVTDPRNRIAGNQHAFDRQNLHFGNSGFKQIFNKELLLKPFFTALAEAICNYVRTASLSGPIWIQSPLTAYRSLIPFIEGIDTSLMGCDELAAQPVSLKQIMEPGIIEMDSYPEKCTATLPFSTWLLVEPGQIFHFSYRGKSFSIDLTELNERSASSYFLINNQKVIKYQAIFNEDLLTDPWLQIKDLNGTVYYNRVFN